MKYIALCDIRSCHNVGSIMRSAAFFDYDGCMFIGITPYPRLQNDSRLPHVIDKIDQRIKKVSLGAEKSLELSHFSSLSDYLSQQQDMQIIGLEQSENSIPISTFTAESSHVLLLGEETKGLTTDQLDLCDQIIEIPGAGLKESLNVSSAASIAIYQCTQGR